MKMIKLILGVLLFIFLLSCEKDDIEIIDKSSLNGKWTIDSSYQNNEWNYDNSDLELNDTLFHWHTYTDILIYNNDFEVVDKIGNKFSLYQALGKKSYSLIIDNSIFVLKFDKSLFDEKIIFFCTKK